MSSPTQYVTQATARLSDAPVGAGEHGGQRRLAAADGLRAVVKGKAQGALHGGVDSDALDVLQLAHDVQVTAAVGGGRGSHRQLADGLIVQEFPITEHLQQADKIMIMNCMVYSKADV